MSEEKTQGETTQHEEKDAVPSRRKFMRNVAVGTAGAALAMSNVDKLHAASRLLARKTRSHANDFLETAKLAKPSTRETQEFQELLSRILSVVEKDPKSRTTFSAIKSYLSNPQVTLEPSSKAYSPLSDLDMVIAVGYLRSMSALQESSKVPTADEIRSRLSDPKAIFDTFESGFLQQLYTKTKAEVASNAAFAQKLADAHKEVTSTASQLMRAAGGETAANKSVSIGPASLLAQCDCTINGVCASTEECLIAVGIIILIIIIAK